MEIPKLPETLRTEEEIIATWKGEVSKPLVSVQCITYNHAPYIEDAIKGFLIQETDYPIEIWIHDDASTDGTREIVESYQKRYPKIIKTILQDENQYSKGKKPSSFFSGKLLGEYIAICEGDDFWVHKKKLQEQVSALKESDAKICFTRVFGLKQSGGTLTLASYGVNVENFDCSEVILNGGEFIPTPTIMVHRSVYDDLPDWFSKAPVGDYFFQILASKDSGALYIPLDSAVYRICALGSWTERKKNLSKSKTLNDLDNYIFCFEKLIELGFDETCVRVVIARHYMWAAYALLNLSKFSESRALIEKSWEAKSFISKPQAILYFSRFFPLIPTSLLKCKAYINRVMKNLMVLSK